MPTKLSKTDDPKFERAYYRAMLRSAFVSLFWAVISDRKKHGLTLISLAKAVGSSKHEVSRWFNGDPNWTVNTIAAIAHALKLTLRIQAVDEHGNIYGSSGLQPSPTKTPMATSGISPQPVKVTRKPAGASVGPDIASSEAA
jgi:DNA-binding phage protein